MFAVKLYTQNLQLMYMDECFFYIISVDSTDLIHTLVLSRFSTAPRERLQEDETPVVVAGLLPGLGCAEASLVDWSVVNCR